MSLSVSMKSAFANLCHMSGFPRFTIRKRAGKRFLILMYHRVVPENEAGHRIQPGMYVSPETFDRQIRYLQRHFDLIPLSRKFDHGGTAYTVSDDRPACILTFDDGWRDFHEHAYPILRRYGVPATVFLPTAFIGTRKPFWTDRLARHISREDLSEKRAAGKGTGHPMLEAITNLAGSNERRLESAIGLLKGLRQSEIDRVIECMDSVWGEPPDSEERTFLDWSEVREMKASGLVSFGSHTHTHSILVHLEEPQVREELLLSKEILLREGAADPRFLPFCYPNGDWNERIADQVREAGYHSTVSTGRGWNEEDALPFGLRRIAVHQDMTRSDAMFGCRIAELL